MAHYAPVHPTHPKYIESSVLIKVSRTLLSVKILNLLGSDPSHTCMYTPSLLQSDGTDETGCSQTVLGPLIYITSELAVFKEKLLGINLLTP